MLNVIDFKRAAYWLRHLSDACGLKSDHYEFKSKEARIEKKKKLPTFLRLSLKAAIFFFEYTKKRFKNWWANYRLRFR